MKKKIYILALAAAVCAILGAGCFAMANVFELDTNVGYFDRGGIFSVMLYVFLSVGVALGIAAGVLNFKKVLVKAPTPGTSVADTVIYALVGIAVAFCGAWDAMQTLSGVSGAYEYMHYIMWIMSAVATICFLIGAVKKDFAGAERVLCGFSMTLFLASRVLVAYFDKSVAVNSPIKILFQIALVCCMLAFTEEAGVVLNRGNLYPKVLFALCASVALAGAMGIGGVIVCLMGIDTSPMSVADGILLCIVCIYSGLHLRLYAKADVTDKAKKAVKE